MRPLVVGFAIMLLQLVVVEEELVIIVGVVTAIVVEVRGGGGGGRGNGLTPRVVAIPATKGAFVLLILHIIYFTPQMLSA